jgi:hypothetical protein
MITDFEKREEHWGKAGWVIRQSWKYDGKSVKLVVLAKNGARYVPPPPPDDPLVAYLMSDFGMKVGAARLLARRVPKKAADGRELTPEERIRAVHRLYEKGGAV